MLKAPILWFVTAIAVMGSYARAAGNDMGAYVYVKQNNDLFVGEGVATLSEFGGDQAKAIEAAKERARADLASGVQVRVSSETTENLQAKDGKVSEELKSQSRSQSDLKLENIKYLEFKGMPAEGQVTVLASLSKADYRRQLAGKGPTVFTRESGISANFAMLSSSWSSAFPASNKPEALGAEFFWRGYSLGICQSSYTWLGGYRNSTDTANSTPLDLNVDIVELSLGYDWTPWHTRLQPFFPVRLKMGAIGGIGNDIPLIFGASAGAGLRLWIIDTIAADISGVWGQGFNSATPISSSGSDSGKAYHFYDTNSTVSPNLSDARLQIGLMFSGF